MLGTYILQSILPKHIYVFIILSIKLTPLVDEVSTFTNTFLCDQVHKKLIRMERFCFYFFIVWTIIFSSISSTNQLVNVINSNDGTAGFDLINYWIPTSNRIISSIGFLCYHLFHPQLPPGGWNHHSDNPYLWILCHHNLLHEGCFLWRAWTPNKFN